jgi:sRNA-binding regulator protein Hfq
MVFVTYEGDVEGVIFKRLCYDFDILVDGEKERLNKLPIKYMYKTKDVDLVKNHMDADAAVVGKALPPIKARLERFQIDTRHLAFARQNDKAIRITLRGGEVFTGTVDWYSHFEVKLTLDPDDEGSVVVFRHAALVFEVVGIALDDIPIQGPRGRGGRPGGRPGGGRPGGGRSSGPPRQSRPPRRDD